MNVKRSGFFIPTSHGPIGAVIAEPETDPVACAIVFQGGGNGRAGPNRFFARIADALAELGLLVLRMDYPGEGDSSLVSGDLFEARTQEAVVEAGGWFQRRNPELDLLVCGRCYGARPAIALAARAPTIVGLGLIGPHLRESPATRDATLLRVAKMVRRARRRGLKPPPGAVEPSVDPALRSDFDVVIAKAPAWALISEDDDDSDDLFKLQDDLGRAAERLEIESVTDLSLRGTKTPESQALLVERVAGWAQRLIRERVPS